MKTLLKKLTWLADFRSSVKSFPASVQDDIGYALYRAQLGKISAAAKPLHGLGSGVMEIAACERRLPGGLYSVNRRLNLRDPCLSEKVQDRNRNAEVRDRPDPASA